MRSSPDIDAATRGSKRESRPNMEAAPSASKPVLTAKDHIDALLKHCDRIAKYKTDVVRSAVPHAREIAAELPDNMLPKGARRKELPAVRDPVGEYLRNYIRAFSITPVEKMSVHVGYFRDQVYGPNKTSILLGPQNDEWLEEGTVNWICNPSKKKSSKSVCVKLSIFYRDAVKYATEKERQLDASKAGSEEWSKAHELNYAYGMMLCVYRVCQHCTSDASEVKAIQGYIAELEKKLRLDADEVPKVDDSALRDFIKNATGGKGVDVSGLPDSSRSLINGVTSIVGSNQHLSNVVQTVLGGIDFEKGTPDAILGNVVGGLLDGKIHEQISLAARDFDPSTLPPAIRNLIPPSARGPSAAPAAAPATQPSPAAAPPPTNNAPAPSAPAPPTSTP